MTSSVINGNVPGYGSIFKINMDGTNYTVLHKFTGGKDGGNPKGSLVINGNVLYGMTTPRVGGSGSGNIFKINTDGSGFANLYESNITPSWYGSLKLVGNVIYGLASNYLYSINIYGSGYNQYDWALWTVNVGSEITENGSLIFDGKSFYDVIRSGERRGVLYKFDPPVK